jgi:imidazolonepropionase-like amidohydrolase
MAPKVGFVTVRCALEPTVRYRLSGAGKAGAWHRRSASGQSARLTVEARSGRARRRLKGAIQSVRRRGPRAVSSDRKTGPTIPGADATSIVVALSLVSIRAVAQPYPCSS